MTPGRKEVLYFVAWAAVVIGLLVFFKIKPPVIKIFDRPEDAPIVLKDDEAKKVVVEPNRVRKVTKRPDGKVEVVDTYVPPDGKVTITTKKDGKEEVKVKTWGVTFSPGLGAGVVGTRWGGYGYARLAYYQRLGLGGGLGINSQGDVVPFGTLMFHVKSNTFIVTGIGSGGKLVVGIGLDF